MTERIEIAVGGQLLEGWASLSVSRRIDALAGSFRFEFAEIEPGDPIARAIQRGDVARILLDGQELVTGAIEELERFYDASSNRVAAGGRSIVADLIDSSAIHEPGEWTGAKVATIVGQLLEPYPLIRFRSDLSDPAGGSISKFALQTGESVFSAIDRLARFRGLLPRDDGGNGVYFDRPGSSRSPVSITRGANILSASVRESESGRFSRYIAHGQAIGAAAWDTAGPGQTLRAEAFDPGIRRARTLVVLSESALGQSDLETRVAFEASGRSARAYRVTYGLQGWTLGGHVWQPGELVPVFDEVLGIGNANGSPVDMLLSGVQFQASSAGGRVAQVELVRPGAFTPEPVPEPPETGPELW